MNGYNYGQSNVMERPSPSTQYPRQNAYGYTYQQEGYPPLSSVDSLQMITTTGTRHLTKEEKEEARRSALEAGFSFDGYQVVRREFFSHRYDPTLTIKNNSITFNNSCISKLDDAIYVQVLVNTDTSMLAIRPCDEGARDAIRWCISKNDKRKSREITCKIFTSKLYELMGWESLYRYKLQGTRIDYQGEQLYVFDLTSTEIYIPQTKDSKNPEAKTQKARTVYPENWRDSFGIPVTVHDASVSIDLAEYSYEDLSKQPEIYVESEVVNS